MSAHYDDPQFSYVKYWNNRSYEHASEEIALTELLKDKKFSSAADIGGGYGRLSIFLTKYAKNVTLVEPSKKQRQIAKNITKDFPNVSIMSGTSEKTSLDTSSQDLIIMIRVTHHLPDLAPTLAEFYRILRPHGVLILEVASSVHFKARIKSLLTGQPILPMPIERRSNTNIRKQTIPFVNHHPSTVEKLLTDQKFIIRRRLSVSNFRSPLIKKLLPEKILLSLESFLQQPLAQISFGPSLFLMCEKGDK